MANRSRPILWLVLGCAGGLLAGLGALAVLLFLWLAPSGETTARIHAVPEPVPVAVREDGRVVERQVSAADVGFAWPLEVPSGTLRVHMPERAVVFGHAGAWYAVNGTASRMARERGWRDVEELRVRSGADGERPSIAPLTRLGLDLGEQLGAREL